MRGDGGFGLVKVMAATLILVVVVVALSNLLVDSLAAALLSRQREAAASLASDVVENAKALGQTVLSAEPAGTQPCTTVTGTPVPVLSATDFQQCFSTTVNGTAFTVSPAIVAATGAPDNVTVTVTWSNGQETYVTSTQVGT